MKPIERDGVSICKREENHTLVIIMWIVYSDFFLALEILKDSATLPYFMNVGVTLLLRPKNIAI